MRGKIVKNADERGFTFIELIVVLSALGALLAITLPGHIRAQDAAKEEETKACLHSISIALERYATDTGEYPNYILGGDEHGWDKNTGCRAITMVSMDMMRPPEDPLIYFGYLYNYPINPFLRGNDGSRAIIMNTGASANAGDGDIRFGYNGDRMGNCLDDPRYLFDGGWGPTRLQYTMYPIPSAYLSVVNSNSPNSFFCMGGYPEWSRQGGGSSETDGAMLRYWWPGEFFYRSGGDYDIAATERPGSNENETIWAWPYKRIDKYMLGAYGSLRTEGLDVIRLTTLEGAAASTMPGAMSGVINDQFYQDNENPGQESSHHDYAIRIQYSNPEVFGGGERGLMPQFPYYDSGDCSWLFGAPDGFPDGIVLVIKSSGNDFMTEEWH